MQTAEWNKLIKKAMGGDAKAFEAIVQQKTKSILFCTNKFLYNPSFAEDAAQEIILSMYKSIHLLQNPQAFHVWMHKIILGVCSRMNKKYPVLSANEEEWERQPDTVFALPEQAAESGESRRLVMEAVNRLPARQRLTILLFYYEELSYKEIAQLLDITVSGVASTIASAKKSLQRNLSGQVLHGVALVPLLTQTLQAEANALATPLQVAQLTQMSQGVAAAGQSAAVVAKTSTLGAKSILLHGAAVAATALVLTGGLLRFTAAPAPDLSASVAMQAAYGAGHINPSRLTLDLQRYQGDEPQWQIQDMTGHALAQGVGMEVTGDWLDLPPGRYQVEWTLEEAGTVFYVSREFEIR